MPIFEYHCNGCGKDFEELVLGGEEAIKCPHCGSGDTDKLISRCRFNNAGWDTPKTQVGHRAAAASSSGCSGCSGGDCSSCG